MNRYTSLFMAIIMAAMTSSGLRAGEIEIAPGKENKVVVTLNTYTELQVTNMLNTLRTAEVITDKGVFTRLFAGNYSKTNVPGKPEVPVKRELIEVPLNAGVKAEVIHSEFVEYDLSGLGCQYPLFPAQPPVSKNDENVSLVYDPDAYSTDAFYPQNLVDVTTLGIMRSVNMGRLDIFPVQYNPVSGKLRIYFSMEVRVTFENPDIQGTEELKRKYENPYFKGTSSLLINYKPLATRDSITSYPVTYLIIADRMFEAQLQPLIEWKTKKGFKVIESYTDEPNVGATTFQIKDYIQDLYENATIENPAPSFVLFVGDIAQIPAWNGNAGSHVSDLYYCEYTNDDFPEIYYGRFSAQTTAQLQPQIDKTLMYEQYLMPDPSYLNEVVMVAGMDASFGGSHGNGQINYGTENYFNEAHGLFSHTYLYPESGSNAANMRQDISDGVSYANYTAHGSESGWADPSFSTSHIPSMTNDGKYALLVGNCCLTNKYDVSECFGEALLRAANKGSLGYIGASNNTYWDEDYYWGVGVGQISGNPPSYEETSLGAYDRTFHDHGETFDEWYMTMDQMVFAGNLAVTEGAPGSSEYYWEAYCLMGDPSLMIYFSEPPMPAASYQPLIPLGSTSFTINTEPYAYVAISMDGILNGATMADPNGLAIVPLQSLNTPGMADLVITGQNLQPLITTILVANPEGPFILVEDFDTEELSGYVNNKVEPGEVIAIHLDLKNWGNSSGENITATLVGSDEFITISDAEEACGSVPAQSVLTVENAFSMVIDENFPDGHTVDFEVVIASPERETWTSEISLLLSAPVLHLNGLTIDDSENGNGNGMLDPGEDVVITASFANKGHSIARNSIATLVGHSGFLQVENPEVPVGDLGLLGSKTVLFNVSVDSKAPEGIIADLEVRLASGAYELSEICPMRIGMMCEDFETGDFTKFSWQLAGNLPWTVISDYPYEGFFSIKSGAITHNQTTEISLPAYPVLQPDSITFYRKVSSEAGDYLRFYIDGQLMDEWSGTVGGWKRQAYLVQAGTHTFKWVYSKNGSNNAGVDAAWIDYIVFPAKMATTLYAGEDAMICSEDMFYTEATATMYSSVEWTTSGTGIFSDNFILDPFYAPSQDDVDNGSVVLTMTITDNDSGVFSDALDLGFALLPAQASQPAGPDQVDLENTFVSTYTTDAIEGSTGFNWTISPENAGLLAGSGPEITVVWNRSFAGTAVITVSAENICGEGPGSEGLTITVDNGTVGIGENMTGDLKVGLYPNPAHQVVHVALGTGMEGNATVRLMNMVGKTVYHQRIDNTTTGTIIDIPLADLPGGIYLLTVRNSQNQVSRKLLVF